MEKKERNEASFKDRTLEELLETDIDDILGDLSDTGETDDLSVDEYEKQGTASRPVDKSVESDKQASQKNKTWSATALTYLHDLVYLLAGLILVFLLLFRVVVVSGTSMNNTLLNGDYLLVLGNTFYHNPQYGDIIVASKQSFDDGAPIVKRVIATEGQKVDIDFAKGIVYVDDVALTETYTLTPTNQQEGISFPLIVEEGCLFVMGDNRNGSKDSRHPEIGQIDKREVLGRVFFLFFPGTNYDHVERDYGRIGVVD